MNNKKLSVKDIIFLLLIINLLIGVLYLVFFHHDNTYSSGGDIVLAGSMLEGKGFSISPEIAKILNELQGEKGGLIEYPELKKEVKKRGISLSYVPYVDQPPGLPFLMLVIWKISHVQKYLPLQILQLLVSIGMVILIYKTGENFFSYRSGLIASFIYTFWLPLKRVAVVPHRDFWGIAFTLFWVYFLSLYWKKGRDKYLIAGAVISGIGTYFQPTIFLLPFFSSFLVLLLRKEVKKKYWQVFLITFILPLIIVSPWIIRNRIVYNRWILMRGGMGLTVWEGLGEMDNPYGFYYSDLRAQERVKELGYNFAPYSVEFHEVLLKDALSFIKRHPGYYIKTVLRRIPRSIILRNDWGFHKYLKVGWADFRKEKGGSLWMYFISYPQDFLYRGIAGGLEGFLVILTFVLAFIAGKKKIYALFPSLFCGLYFYLVYLPLHLEPRYFLSAEASFIISLGIGIDAYSRNFQEIGR